MNTFKKQIKAEVIEELGDYTKWSEGIERAIDKTAKRIFAEIEKGRCKNDFEPAIKGDIILTQWQFLLLQEQFKDNHNDNIEAK
jgi:hypothetical protein